MAAISCGFTASTTTSAPGHGFAVVGGDVHTEFIGQRDATRLMRFADTDVLRRQAAGDEAANQGAAHVSAADERCVDVHVSMIVVSGTSG